MGTVFVSTKYKKPIQDRAKNTENQFLDALNILLVEQSFEETTVYQIAELAGATKSSFLKRFGSKDGALICLFKRYALEASGLMQRVLNQRATSSTEKSLSELLFFASAEFEALLREHFSANRAMNEYVKKNLRSHSITQSIFLECVQMMSSLQRTYCSNSGTEMGAKAAA